MQRIVVLSELCGIDQWDACWRSASDGPGEGIASARYSWSKAHVTWSQFARHFCKRVNDGTLSISVAECMEQPLSVMQLELKELFEEPLALRDSPGRRHGLLPALFACVASGDLPALFHV